MPCDLDRLVALCPPCHAQTDTPYARGRLVITPPGAGRFTVEVSLGLAVGPSPYPFCLDLVLAFLGRVAAVWPAR